MATAKKAAKKKPAKKRTIPKLPYCVSGSTSPVVNVSGLCDYLQDTLPAPAAEQFQRDSYDMTLEGQLTPIERIRLQHAIATELEIMGKEVYSTSNKTLRFSNKYKDKYED